MKKTCHKVGFLLFMERKTGIEPAISAWEADVLPLYYSRRIFNLFNYNETGIAQPTTVC